MKTKLRLTACLVAVICMVTAFSVPAFAYAESHEDDTPLTTPAPTPTPTAAPIVSGSTLTPSGNLTLVDDYSGSANKQFITVETRDGNYYYIIIDRSGSSENVYFLNMVDEADLLALMEEAGDELPAVCTCSDKCVAGHVNTSCPVCKVNMSECDGEAKPTSTAQPDDTQGNSGNADMKKTTAMIVLVLALGICSVVCVVKLKKGKADSKGKTDLDSYDFGEDDDDEEYETEDEEEKS